jgi:hypothetical protein
MVRNRAAPEMERGRQIKAPFNFRSAAGDKADASATEGNGEKY